MRNYEVAFIAHPDVKEQALAALAEKVQGWITSGGGTILKTVHWGKRRLAYEIRKQHEGQYVLVYANMPPTLGVELERQFRITEEIMRFMITLHDPPPEPPAEKSARAAPAVEAPAPAAESAEAAPAVEAPAPAAEDEPAEEALAADAAVEAPASEDAVDEESGE